MKLITRLSPFVIVVFSLLFFLFSTSSSSSRASHDGRAREPGKVGRRSSVSFDPILEVNLSRRDDGSCSGSNPCRNGACCGQSGYCGYGDAYCGSGCQSNCDAKAECGQYASPSGKTCPLNTCCSQYGFCGTTTDFCTNNCQSNCVLNPSPSGPVGSSVLDRVIGYYESWSARSSCRNVQPTDLPLDALTHLYFAFASIDPSTFDVTTMDSSTPESLFQQVVDVKQNKPSLQVFVSIGGWSFSDNGTVTQPIFGNIASSATNRATFASNVLTFLLHYGFDGLDIDWEYPGAPDRGGQLQDTENFVLLMQQLRTTFATSPKKLGLTFTAPSSYWYLRWFDLPGMMQYADWVNVMTYDLHDLWDSSDPIGSIVQGHTNLTEIKLAMDLFWRVQIPPAQISMGFGFYGRSFQLSDPSCNQPGCAFKGGAAPGPCTDQSGVLSYYEIQAVLAQNPNLQPVWDTVAAVKYLTFNNDQWVSYDDADTFQQKVDWANSVGLSGAFIWASDLDDDKYTAHTALTGQSSGTFSHPNLQEKAFSPSVMAMAENLNGQSGQSCSVIHSACVKKNVEIGSSMGCPTGQKLIGWEIDNCAPGSAHPICCPYSEAPSYCHWTPDPYSCVGGSTCNLGETTVARSLNGDAQLSPITSCALTEKSFCCRAPDYSQIVNGCRWTDCHRINYQQCNSGETMLGQAQLNGQCPDQALPGGKVPTANIYCCEEPVRLENCEWRGTGPSCSDNACLAGEVSVMKSLQGEEGNVCRYGARKNFCCTPTAAPPSSLDCPMNTCDFADEDCDNDEYGPSNTYQLGFIFKRSSDELDADEGNSTEALEKRGASRKYTTTLEEALVITELARFVITWVLPSYPSIGSLFGSDRTQIVPHTYYTLSSTSCGNTDVSRLPIANTNNLPSGLETEHPLDAQVMQWFGRQIGSGRFRNGTSTRTPALSHEYLLGDFQRNSLPAGLGLIGDGSAATSPQIPMRRAMEELGSNGNSAPFLAAERSINGMKGRIMGFRSPIDLTDIPSATLNRRIAEARTNPNTYNINRMVTNVKSTIATFRYMSDALFIQHWQSVMSAMRAQFVTIAANQQEAAGLAEHWDEFIPAHLHDVVADAQSNVRQILERIRMNFMGSRDVDNEIRALIDELEAQIATMVFPPDLYKTK